YANGGLIKAANGAYIGRDNTLVMAHPGEFVMRKSAVDMIGADNLRQINAMGSQRVSAASNIQPVQQNPQGGATLLNVYVVSPDQKPSLTKNDVIVTISEDLVRGGTIKKLV